MTASGRRGGYVLDAGSHRWRYNPSGTLIAYFEYYPDHRDVIGNPWKRIWT